MNRKEYTDAVLTALRHVTDRERLAIRAELDAHIEDHIAALQSRRPRSGWTSGYRWGTTCCMSIGSVWDRMIRWENRWRK